MALKDIMITPFDDPNSFENTNTDLDLQGFKPPRMQTADASQYTYKGQNLTGSGTYIGALRKFLESQGKGDLLSTPNNNLMKAVGGSGNRNIDMRDRTIGLPGGELKDINSLPQPQPQPDMQPPPGMAGQIGLGGIANLMSIPGQMTGFGETLGGFGEQLTGVGNQLTGYQDALGGFGEQVGGFGKQFENLNTRLDSMEKGIASLGEQFQPQQQQPKQQWQQQWQNPYSSPYGSSMYGGLGSMMRYF